MPKINVEKIHSLTGHKDCLYSIVGGNTDKFYTAGGDGLIAEWSMKEPELGKMIARFKNSVYSMHLNEEDNYLLVGQNFEGIHKIDLNSKEETKSKKITESYIFDILELNTKVICASGDGSLLILNGLDLSLEKKISLSHNSLRSLAYNKELDHLAIGASDNSIYILKANSFELVQKLESHTNSVFTLAYHPEKPYLLSAGRDAHVKIWETSDYALQDEIIAHMYAINNLYFSPDNQYFATCSMDKSIKLWDANTFKLLKVIDKARHAGHGTSVNKLWWSNIQSRLVSVSDDRSAAIWDIQIEN